MVKYYIATHYKNLESRKNGRFVFPNSLSPIEKENTGGAD
ncbi:hypothetical protein Pan241w_46040 [Gimesia alba]|uniref:Uncharacterized protein n=1 Tax=Gimesia alba TaxID=2527973 RepID=A0A517RKT4_9PLAN|nr:hypothetical protein Pan241w_46040 [Gimesia alba]